MSDAPAEFQTESATDKSHSKLRELLTSWLRSALAVMGEIEIPQREHVEVEFTPTGWNANYPMLPDYRNALHSHDDELRAVPGVAEIVSELESIHYAPDDFFVDEMVEPLPSEARQEHFYNLILYTFLLNYLESAHSFSISASAFDELFDQFAQLAFSPKSTTVEWQTLFWNVDSKVGRIELEPGIAFRRLSLKEQRSMAARQVASGGDVWLRTNLVLEVERKTDGRFQGYGEGVFEDQQNIEDAALLLLRLIRNERIDKLGTAVDSPNCFARQLRLFPVLRHTIRRPTEGKTYLLSNRVAEQLPELWPLARRAVMNPDLEVPLTRFADAYDRMKETDRLLDYWVALESLYLRSDTRSMLGETAAGAISFYLGKDSNERTKIYNAAAQSYRLRSKVVHGERYAKQANFSSVVRSTEDVLRRSLVKRMAE